MRKGPPAVADLTTQPSASLAGGNHGKPQPEHNSLAFDIRNLLTFYLQVKEAQLLKGLILMKPILLQSLRTRVETNIKFVKKVFKPTEIKELDRFDLDDISESVFTSLLFENSAAIALNNSKEQGIATNTIVIKATDIETYIKNTATLQPAAVDFSTQAAHEILVKKLSKIRSEIQKFDEIKRSLEHTIIIRQTQWKDCALSSEIAEHAATPSSAQVVLVELGHELFSSSGTNGDYISILPEKAKYHASSIDPPTEGLYAAIGVIIDGEMLEIYVDDDRDIDSIAVISNLSKNSTYKTIELTYEGPKKLSSKGKKIQFLTEDHESKSESANPDTYTELGISTTQTGSSENASPVLANREINEQRKMVEASTLDAGRPIRNAEIKSATLIHSSERNLDWNKYFLAIEYVLEFEKDTKGHAGHAYIHWKLLDGNGEIFSEYTNAMWQSDWQSDSLLDETLWNFSAQDVARISSGPSEPKLILHIRDTVNYCNPPIGPIKINSKPPEKITLQPMTIGNALEISELTYGLNPKTSWQGAYCSAQFECTYENISNQIIPHIEISVEIKDDKGKSLAGRQIQDNQFYDTHPAPRMADFSTGIAPNETRTAKEEDWFKKAKLDVATLNIRVECEIFSQSEATVEKIGINYSPAALERIKSKMN
jgi:hypothetical protein